MRVGKYVPPGGHGLPDGRVMTKAEVTAAVQLYARKHGYYARTVRTMTVLFKAAMAEHAKRLDYHDPITGGK